MCDKILFYLLVDKQQVYSKISEIPNIQLNSTKPTIRIIVRLSKSCS